MQSVGHAKRVHILNGVPVLIKPPTLHLLLNENGDKDESGTFDIPERISDVLPERIELNHAPLKGE